MHMLMPYITHHAVGFAHFAGLVLTVGAVHSNSNKKRNRTMQDHETQRGGDENSRLDAFAAVALILLAVITAVVWISQH